MKEIGGYIELDKYHGHMLYGDGIKLNCGRNALAYLIQIRGINKLLMPKFMCDSCDQILRDYDIDVKYYSIGIDFRPINIQREENEWLYLVNFYGQLSNKDILAYGRNIICDNAQAYFAEPILGIDTIYTCRKYFGVPDGAILCTEVPCNIKDLPQDESFERMHFLLGRFERSASEFYQEYVLNNHFFVHEPIKRMSKLTENFLHGIDYVFISKRRTENFIYLHKQLSQLNKLSLTVPEGAFMYPLYLDNGAEIREKMQERKIYIPLLWPAVLHSCQKGDLEYDMANNILPLPIDQRYGIRDMEYILQTLGEII